MAILYTHTGTICRDFVPATPTPDIVDVSDGGVFSLAIQMVLNGSTAQIEQSVDGVTWFLVFAQPSGAVVGLITTAGAVDNIWLIDRPLGFYRVNVTGHVGNVTATYKMGPSLWK